MKKLLNFTVLSVLAVLGLGVTACKPEPPKSEPKPIDFRNKNADGVAIIGRAARVGDIEFKSVFIVDDNKMKLHSNYRITKEVNGNYYVDPVDVEAGNNGEESKAKLESFASNVIITSHKDGFQVEFTAPEGFAKVDGWNIAYIDHNGNESTGVVGKTILNGEEGSRNSAIDEDGKLTAAYPLVIKGQESKFLIHLWANNDVNERHWEANLFYSITSENGLGCVDDMPKAYDSSDYLEIEEGHILKISKMIPPMAKNLTREFYLDEQDKGTAPYGVEGDYAVTTGLGYVLDDPASETETDACEDGKTIEFTIDLNDYTEYSEDYIGRIEAVGRNQPFIFARFNWSYTLDEYPNYIFTTPQLFSNVFKNTIFVQKD